jgi:hypothetical protein
MIEPLPPAREEQGWHVTCLVFAGFLLLMLSGVLRACAEGRL